MNKVEIDLTIKMGDTCENTMSMEEARMLYDALKPIFDNTGSNQHVRTVSEPVEHRGNPMTAEDIKIAQAKMPPPKDMRSNEPHSSSEQAVPAYDSTLPPPNLKVEAAKERAAARTRGCGRR